MCRVCDIYLPRKCSLQSFSLMSSCGLSIVKARGPEVTTQLYTFALAREKERERVASTVHMYVCRCISNGESIENT